MYEITMALTEKISDEIKDWIWARKQLVTDIGKTLAGLSIALAFSYPKEFTGAIYSISSWNHFILTNCACFIFLAFYLPPIIRREIEHAKKKDAILFFGIPLEQLIEHITTTGTFKREDIERKFNVSRSIYADMVKKLDEAGVFIRGENNARLLDIRLTREDIADRLSPTPLEEEEIQHNFTKTSIKATQTDCEDLENE